MKKALDIPATFTLGGRTWQVIEEDQSSIKEDIGFGCEIYDMAQIFLYRNNLGHPVPDERKEYTYVHEIVHAALDELCYKELSNDEAFVNRLSHALHQILTTGEGTLE